MLIRSLFSSLLINDKLAVDRFDDRDLVSRWEMFGLFLLQGYILQSDIVICTWYNKIQKFNSYVRNSFIKSYEIIHEKRQNKKQTKKHYHFHSLPHTFYTMQMI